MLSRVVRAQSESLEYFKVFFFFFFFLSGVWKSPAVRSSLLSKRGTHRPGESCLSDRWGDGGMREVLHSFRVISLVKGRCWPRIQASVPHFLENDYWVILANATLTQEGTVRHVYIFFYKRSWVIFTIFITKAVYVYAWNLENIQKHTQKKQK